MSAPNQARPRLAPKARLRWDSVARKYALVYPERALLLNDVAAFIVRQCDGATSVTEIARALKAEFDDTPQDAETIVQDLLRDFAARALVLGLEDASSARSHEAAASADPWRAPRPFTLIAELSYRCPLRCGYCSNPVELERFSEELDTDTWLRVFTEARDLGVLQVHLTGGEPLVRRDLEAIVAHCRTLGVYTNLITSGLPFDAARLSQLCKAGLDNVQISIQDIDAEGSKRIAGRHALDEKIASARLVKALGLPLTLNVVLHRHNIARTAAFLQLGKDLGADRIELANTQYLGWALANKEQLLPTEAQLHASATLAAEAKRKLLGKAEVLFVKPDYFSQFPRACMDGWGRRFLHISPDGQILPCHAAMSIAGLAFPNARASSLADAWAGEAFARYRGDSWMKEPCASCERKALDFGGCRCQAFALTGDAAATDPACSLAPEHGLVRDLRARSHAGEKPIVLRRHRSAGQE
jgi:PqqA peptide cyclase